jgi:hypothetical protein
LFSSRLENLKLTVKNKYVLAEREQKGEIKVKAVEKTEEKAVEVCPLCGSEMEKGFLFGIRAVTWNKEKSRCMSGEEVIPFGLAGSLVAAYRCKKCKLIIFRYGKT